VAAALHDITVTNYWSLELTVGAIAHGWSATKLRKNPVLTIKAGFLVTDIPSFPTANWHIECLEQRHTDRSNFLQPKSQ